MLVSLLFLFWNVFLCQGPFIDTLEGEGIPLGAGYDLTLQTCSAVFGKGYVRKEG